MTVIDATILLYGWFEKESSFKMESCFSRINPITEYPEEDKAALECALREMEKHEFLCCHEGIWVLRRAVDSIEQAITVNSHTALQISILINTFCDVIGDSRNQSDPQNLTEADINSLVFICHTLTAEKMEEEKNNLDGLES